MKGVYTGEKPFRCYVFEKSFSTQYNLKTLVTQDLSVYESVNKSTLLGELLCRHPPLVWFKSPFLGGQPSNKLSIVLDTSYQLFYKNIGAKLRVKNTKFANRFRDALVQWYHLGVNTRDTGVLTLRRLCT